MSCVVVHVVCVLEEIKSCIQIVVEVAIMLNTVYQKLAMKASYVASLAILLLKVKSK